MPTVIPPVVDRDDAYFWEGVAKDKLLLLRCASCKKLRHPPVPMCGACHSVDVETVESAGRGIVYSWIMSHHPTEPDAKPRIVALVQLDEGVRLVSNLQEIEVGDVRNGMAVEVLFVEIDGVKLPQFRPVVTTAAGGSTSTAGA